MLFRVSPKADSPRLRELLWETMQLAQSAGIDPTDLEVRVFGSPPRKRTVAVFQYLEGYLKREARWQKVSGRILFQPRAAASDEEIVRVFAHELGHLRDFQRGRLCCFLDRTERERRAHEFAEEILVRWLRTAPRAERAVFVS